MMEERVSFKPYLGWLIFMLFLGWGGLFYLVTRTQPFVWQRWLFFALLFTAMTSSAFPFVFFWHHWRGTAAHEMERVVIRQSLWVGAYAALYAWLEMMLTVHFGLALGVALAFLALESAIRMIERGRWMPPAVQEKMDD